MKIFLLVTSLFVSGLAQATAWEKVLDCDNGAAVVDVNKDERRNLQLVIRNEGILKYLHETGAISLKYGDTESVSRGWQDHGVFQPADFQFISGSGMSMWDSRIMFANRDGASLKVRFVDRRSYTEKPSSCEDCLSMACESQCRTVTYDVELANWNFQSCR